MSRRTDSTTASPSASSSTTSTRHPRPSRQPVALWWARWCAPTPWPTGTSGIPPGAPTPLPRTSAELRPLAEATERGPGGGRGLTRGGPVRRDRAIGADVRDAAPERKCFGAGVPASVADPARDAEPRAPLLHAALPCRGRCLRASRDGPLTEPAISIAASTVCMFGSAPKARCRVVGASAPSPIRSRRSRLGELRGPPPSRTACSSRWGFTASRSGRPSRLTGG